MSCTKDIYLELNTKLAEVGCYLGAKELSMESKVNIDSQLSLFLPIKSTEAMGVGIKLNSLH